jgi:hypothetical protein
MASCSPWLHSRIVRSLRPMTNAFRRASRSTSSRTRLVSPPSRQPQICMRLRCSDMCSKQCADVDEAPDALRLAKHYYFLHLQHFLIAVALAHVITRAGGVLLWT